MKTLITLVTILVVLSLVSCQSLTNHNEITGYFKKNSQGWVWVEQTNQQKIGMLENYESLPTDLLEKNSYAQNELNKKLKNVYADPTVQNMQNYFLYEKYIINNGVDLNTKEVNNKAKEFISLLSKDHDFLYFTMNNCKFCVKFYPTVEKVAAKHGFNIVTISSNERTNSYFKNAESNVELYNQLNVKTVPALFLIERSTQSIYPLTRSSSVSKNDLEKNIILTLKGKKIKSE
ncbi:MAG: conjugal transfer protein TraF [Sphingobacteriia bacterium]|nr:conjugal transfer protein TraF [Sphingobacteriia bacterium]